MTGRDLVTTSLRLIGAAAPGESLPAQEANDALSSLNRMIASWSNESLLLYKNEQETFNLIPGTQIYTMGSGGSFNTERPQFINDVLLRVETSTPALEYPLNILSRDEWSIVRMKEVASTIPTDCYISEGYPLHTIYLYPKPSASYKLVIYSQKLLSSILLLDDEISLPPGYEDALIYNLAIRLAPEYGRQTPAEVGVIAADSKAALKRLNSQPNYLRCDNGISARGRYNIFTGGYDR